MAFGVVEHHVARAVAVLPTEELSREREQLGLVGRDEQHLLRAPHEEVEVRTLRAVDHERKTAAAAHARLSLDGPPSRARNGRTLGYPGMREVLPRSPYHPGEFRRARPRPSPSRAHQAAVGSRPREV